MSKENISLGGSLPGIKDTGRLFYMLSHEYTEANLFLLSRPQTLSVLRLCRSTQTSLTSRSSLPYWRRK